jgi:hypothetical protein
MATGLYITQNGSVMVSYGPKHIPISCAQYKANGYKPPLDKLPPMPLDKPRADPQSARWLAAGRFAFPPGPSRRGLGAVRAVDAGGASFDAAGAPVPALGRAWQDPF